MTKWVYSFGDGKSEGEAGMRNLLGGKGANLAEMSNLGLPVPPGLTVTTEVCTYYYGHNETYPSDLKEQVAKASDTLDKADTRAKQMRLALRKVEALPESQAQALLPLADPQLPLDDDLAS